MRYLMFTLFTAGMFLVLSDPTFAQQTYIPEPGNWWHCQWGCPEADRIADAAAVPVPATLLLFGAGFAGLVAWRSRENRG